MPDDTLYPRSAAIRGELKSAAADLREARAKPDSVASRRLPDDFRIML